MNANPGNHQPSLAEIVGILVAILGGPLTLFTIFKDVIEQPVIASVVALIMMVLTSVYAVHFRRADIRRIIIAWLALIVVVLAGFLTWLTWRRPMTVEGIIRDTAGNPVKNNAVVLFDRGGRRYEAKTNAEGHYQFIDVPAGKYKVQTCDSEIEGEIKGAWVRGVKQSIAVAPSPTPTPYPTTTTTPTPTITPTSTPKPTATPTTTPTPTPFPTFSPTVTPTHTPTSTSTWIPTPTPACRYQANTDKDAIPQIIHAESEAVNREDISIIRAIFAEDAIIQDAVSGEEWNDPIGRYETLFEDVDFTDAIHFEIQPAGAGMIENVVVWFTSGSEGRYRVGGGGWNSYFNTSSSDPSTPFGSEHWTLKKNRAGCWVITEFTFNAGHIPFPP
jgi:hypothetical protein